MRLAGLAPDAVQLVSEHFENQLPPANAPTRHKLFSVAADANAASTIPIGNVTGSGARQSPNVVAGLSRQYAAADVFATTRQAQTVDVGSPKNRRCRPHASIRR